MIVEVSPEGICQIEGIPHPAVGFGTYLLKDEVCYKAVTAACKSGYRIIDTATRYDNFEPTGEALKKFGRDQCYLVSKVWPDSHTSGRLKKDLKQTLERLQTESLDLYFLHWPNSRVSIEKTLETLEDFRSKNLVRHLGLSNVTINHFKRAFEIQFPVTWIQVEMSPFYYDPELIAFCHKNGIGVQAWGPLGQGRIGQDALLATMAHKYGKTPSQIALKWILQHRCVPLPGSRNPKHIRENIDIMDFMLSKEDMTTINARARTGKRVRITAERGLGFTDEFDFSYEECWPKTRH